MRPPQELDTVDWTSCCHAYGAATDVPESIRALYAGDAERAARAVRLLFNKVLNRDSVYPATVAAVPFLAHAAVHAVHERASVLAFLAGAGGRGPEPQAGIEEEGYAQVAAEVSGLLHLLADHDPKVRLGAVRVARCATGQSIPAALRELTARYEADPVAEVRMDALAVLTRLDPDQQSADRRLHDALTDPLPAVRAAASLTLLERTHAPYPPDLVAVLAEAIATADSDLTVDQAAPRHLAERHQRLLRQRSPFTPRLFPGIGDTDSRLTAIAEQDADAAAAVAGGFVARGDVDGRGSRRAHELSVTWRDRENDTLALLTAALPHEHTSFDRSHLLYSIACWTPFATQPQPGLADHLLRQRLSDNSEMANRAQLSLGRLGDERLLTAVPNPYAEAVAALAARTRHRDHQRLALQRPAYLGFDDFLATLAPDDVHALLPDLKAVLHRMNPAEPDRPELELARLFGDWGVQDPEVLGLLDEAARSGHAELAATAAVSAARLGADPEPALRELKQAMAADDATYHCIEEAGRLGPAAAPLLPFIEPYHGHWDEWARLRAAEADWRITQDPARAVAALTGLIELPAHVTSGYAYTTSVRAVEVLARIGTTPDALRRRVEHWATSPRRVIRPDDFFEPVHEQRCLDEDLREAALHLLLR
ncbi:hypothetical protein [Streptomyces sp. NPDC059874]|uniref:hypothetical protein n=1 Tax=Streptomyces sp. NPDC059874 TaxID=3346983 RepID=UPI003646A1F6